MQVTFSLWVNEDGWSDILNSQGSDYENCQLLMLEKLFFLHFLFWPISLCFFLYHKQTKICRPIRIIGDPDNHCPDKWSSAVFRSREGSDSVGTILRLGRFGFRIPAGSRDFSVFQNVLTTSGGSLASCSIGIGLLFRESNGRGVKLTTHLHLAPSGMTGAVSLLLLYVWMSCTWTTIFRCLIRV